MLVQNLGPPIKLVVLPERGELRIVFAPGDGKAQELCVEEVNRVFDSFWTWPVIGVKDVRIGDRWSWYPGCILVVFWIPVVGLRYVTNHPHPTITTYEGEIVHWSQEGPVRRI